MTKSKYKTSQKLVYENLTDEINFGSYNGKTIKYVIDNEQGFIDWAFKNMKGFRLKKEALKYYNESIK
jgi:hypothetical protein